MKKYLDIRNIIILVLLASTALVATNPGGFMPNRVKHLHIIDSIPYPVHDTIPVEVEVEVEVPVEVEILVEKLIEVPDRCKGLSVDLLSHRVAGHYTYPAG